MINVTVTDEYEVNVGTEGEGEEILTQMTLLLASLRYHEPKVFTAENIQKCVDIAKNIEPDKEEAERDEE